MIPENNKAEVELTQFNSPMSPEKRNDPEEDISPILLQPVPLNTVSEPQLHANMMATRETEVSVGQIDPRKLGDTATTTSLPSNVSFAAKEKIIDFNPPKAKHHPLSPVKVTRVDPRSFEAGGYKTN